MINKCAVKLNNSAATVVCFNGTEIQFPPINREASNVKVLFDNGKYSIVPDDYVEQRYETPVSKMKRAKKTTITTDCTDSNLDSI